jgi:membrane associated rhomboid family serine protease
MSQKKFNPFISAAFVGITLLLIMWGVYILDWIFPYNFAKWGVKPREVSGLWGILFSPFIHGGFEHIVNNSPPILILSWALYYFYRKIGTEILLISWIVGGLFVWIAGRSAYHIGMSGVIYSLAFFIFFSGVFRKETKVMAIALFVAFLYGSMIWGVFPLDPRVSFEAHLFGAIVGIALAYFYRKQGETFKKKRYQFEIDDENEAKMLAQGYRKVTDENGFTKRWEYIGED